MEGRPTGFTHRTRIGTSVEQVNSGAAVVNRAGATMDEIVGASKRVSGLLGEIAERVQWAGKLHDIETWKRLLVAAWGRATGEHTMVLPALDGHGVDIVFRRTSQMTQAEMRDLLGFIDAWKAERPEFQEEIA